MSDERTRDLLRNGGLDVRARLGERTLRRVGGRQWDRPRVFVSAALYKRCGLKDPWSPEGTGGRDAVGIGPVSLRLGEPKRQPAPHLRPKEPKAKKQADPLSKWRRPAPSPAPRPSAAPAPPPQARTAPVSVAAPAAAPDAKDPAGFTPTPDRVERGMFRNKVKRGLKAPIPVRPELRSGSEEGKTERSAAGVPRRGPPAAPAARPTRRSTRGRLAARPRQRAVELGGPEVVEAARPVARSSVRDLGPPEEVLEPTLQAAPAPAPAPVDRRPPGKPMGLDDLFGGAPEGRVRMRPRRPAKAGPDETSEA